MKIKILLSVFVNLFILGNLLAQEDVIVIDGGLENAGMLEQTINGDTTEAGERVNPNRIYELKAGEFYVQHGPININNHDGTLTIRGQSGGAKPVVIKQPLDEININANQISSSLSLINVQYHGMETDGHLPWQQWNIKGDDHHLWVEDCLIENANGIVFNLNNVKKGAKIIIRNTYFRDLMSGSQWWAHRAVQAKVPVDTFIFENNTVTGGGLTVLGQECLFDYSVINHNTFINNHKYPFLNQYWREVYFTNNLFVNANMVGEDTVNVATGGQDPDALLHGISGVDTITNRIFIQSKYLDADSNLTAEVDELEDIIYYAADNVVTYSATLDPYYNGDYNDVYDDMPASYLTWSGIDGPHRVLNVPGIWTNSRSQALIAEYDNIKDENNSIYEMMTADLGMVTDPLPQAAADTFIVWNMAQWGVPDVTAPTDWSTYHFGDYDPNTVPGVETEAAAAGEGGITKISDMVEDFSYTADLTSSIDGKPIGALHWFDMEFDSEALLTKVKNAYMGIVGVEEVVAASEFNLVNYPNPFKNNTVIRFELPERSQVNVSVYDISGKLVETLLNEEKISGMHSVNFSPEQLGNGIYFCKLSTDMGVTIRKMTLLK